MNEERAFRAFGKWGAIHSRPIDPPQPEYQFYSPLPEDSTKFKELMNQNFSYIPCYEIDTRGKQKEVEFLITCYLSDVESIEVFLKDKFPLATFEKIQLAREIQDPEVPVGYKVKAILDY